MKTNTKSTFFLLTLCLAWLIELSQAAQDEGRNLGKRGSYKKKSKKGSKKGSKKADNTILVASISSGVTRDWESETSVVPGDRTIFDDPLFYYNPYTEMREGPEIGRSRGVCTVLSTPEEGPVFQCIGTYVFYNKGKITIAGDYQPLSDINSVTGGTGYFKGVTGEVSIKVIPQGTDFPMNVFEICLYD